MNRKDANEKRKVTPALEWTALAEKGQETCPFFRTDLPTKEYERIGSCPAIDENGSCLSVCSHRAHGKAAPEGEDDLWDKAYDEGYEQGKIDATAKSLNPDTAQPALKGEEIRDCDTCMHDGDCFVTMLKCRGYCRQIRGNYDA